ncbi:MAG TPA: universal stress protein [Vicinamibacterales bacterium]|nr:universal stress protein [Vicinamibacterales bacterium]HPW20583.1 universal stress protein [Vicinamibacterales bacterium]
MLPFKRIVCPVDFSPASQHAVSEAVAIAKVFQAEILLVHVLPVLPAAPSDPNFVFQVPEYERALRADAERQLARLAAGVADEGIAARTAVGHGDAGSEIVRLAKEDVADLIVIATHGMTGWRHVMFGSVAEKVVRLAGRPVLTIPALRD